MSRPIIFILNGPNLNMLGRREPDIYGHQTLDDIEKLCRADADRLGLDVDFRQSNHEGELVTWIQDCLGKVQGVVINAAAYTHTSVAIHDALKLLPVTVPIVEVHLSNPKEREAFRHFSYVESLAFAHFAGHGAKGYSLALEAMAEKLGTK
jgi:3-dehydroquinate dehydratase-2